MAKVAGAPSWTVNQETEKPKMTEQTIDEKTQEITRRFSDLFIAFGLGVSTLSEEGDPLGLYCLSIIVKQLLADGADRCGDIVDKAIIVE